MTASDVGTPLLFAFEGEVAPPELLEAIAEGSTPGVTLYRSLNLQGPDDVLALTGSIRAAARRGGQPTPIIAVDHEGGQLEALAASTTALPGNMALAATGSEDLARRAGEVIGRELSALGCSVDWAPVCDVNSDPRNPGVGTRSFGDDPALVARLAAAMVTGIRSAGVAASAKHFPGGGDTAVDPHHGLPQVRHDLTRLREVELVPFAAVVEAGVDVVMVSHVAFPAVDTEVEPRSAMLSRRLLQDVLRDELRFDGVAVSDALDMGALDHDSLSATTRAAVEAGIDLLLAGPGQAARPAGLGALRDAFKRTSASGAPGDPWAARLRQASDRVARLRRWLDKQPAISTSVIRSAEHVAVAQEIARRSITLVRDHRALLPLRPAADDSILVLAPPPTDLTPADTSSYVPSHLGAAIRRFHARTEEQVIALDPDESHIKALVERATAATVVIVGTVDAGRHPGQARLVESLAGHPKLIVVALRTPYDLDRFPGISTYLATYSIQRVALDALAAVLFATIPAAGRLPVHVAAVLKEPDGAS